MALADTFVPRVPVVDEPLSFAPLKTAVHSTMSEATTTNRAVSPAYPFAGSVALTQERAIDIDDTTQYGIRINAVPFPSFGVEKVSEVPTWRFHQVINPEE